MTITPVTAVEASQGHIQGLLESSRFSDLVIRTTNRDFKVHKCIVSQCCFVAGACKEGFTEAETGVIEMLHDEPRSIDALIQFLYTCDYRPLPNNNPLLYHAQVYATAEKYCMPFLKSLAVRKFKLHVSQSWKVDNDAKLDFLDAVEYIYDSTPETDRALRDLAVLITKENSKDLFNMTTMTIGVYNKARTVLQDYPELTMDLAMASSTPIFQPRDSLMETEDGLNEGHSTGLQYDSDDEQGFV